MSPQPPETPGSPTRPLPRTASPFEVALLEKSLSWLRALVRPVFVGDDNIPTQRPLLFVGNHTLGGVVDVPQLVFHLYHHHGIFLRGLGEKAHWKIPVWRRLVERFGGVDGNRENAAQLFDEGHCVLVFPGGAREAFKRGDQRYQLLWGKRVGFARLAARHGVTIVPFAAVGADDVWRVLADQDAVYDSPVGQVARGLGVRRDVVPPVMVGQGPLGLPGIRRQYFAFMPPVPTQQWAGRDDDEAAWAVRQQVEAAIEGGIDKLIAVRNADPDADWKVPAARGLALRLVKAAGLLNRAASELDETER